MDPKESSSPASLLSRWNETEMGLESIGEGPGARAAHGLRAMVPMLPISVVISAVEGMMRGEAKPGGSFDAVLKQSVRGGLLLWVPMACGATAFYVLEFLLRAPLARAVGESAPKFFTSPSTQRDATVEMSGWAPRPQRPEATTQEANAVDDEAERAAAMAVLGGRATVFVPEEGSKGARKERDAIVREPTLPPTVLSRTLAGVTVTSGLTLFARVVQRAPWAQRGLASSALLGAVAAMIVPTFEDAIVAKELGKGV